MTESPRDEQLALVRATVRRARPVPPEGVAAVLPVARVALDVSLAHLDRPFDYLVPASMADSAQPGVRVRARFAGKVVGGYVLERVAGSEHRLSRLDRVVSAESVLSPAVAELARAVADRYAGSMADVLRLAVPARHARVEGEVRPAAPTTPLAPPTQDVLDGGWGRYPTGRAFLRSVAAGQGPCAVWTALPGPTWPDEIAVAVQVALASGRGALVVVPDQRDLDRVSTAVEAACGPGQHVAISAELGPAERYRRWLAVRRGVVRAVVGTRAAMFAPVADLGLAVVWDDGDDLHDEPHAPYPHVREVLGLRATTEGAGLLVGGFARTAEAQALVEAGAAHPVEATRAVVRATAPQVRAAGDERDLARDPAARSARLPSLAWETARTALELGPVLVQVPRRGYLPALACQDCRTPARCATCSGPLALRSGHAVPYCRWCGRVAGGWRCRACEGTRLRAQVVGAGRTAEELGRAFPGVPVRTSGRDGVLAQVDAQPQLVVSTPGAEPLADGGYAAALLLDGWALVGRADLRAGEEALRRWLAAAALVRPAPQGGRVVVLAESTLTQVQELIRWDPAGAASRELADRRQLGFPPAVRLATLTGSASAVAEFLSALELPPGAEVLGPQPVDIRPANGREGDSEVRALVRAPLGGAEALVAELKATQGGRSARKAREYVSLRVDPADFG